MQDLVKMVATAGKLATPQPSVGSPAPWRMLPWRRNSLTRRTSQSRRTCYSSQWIRPTARFGLSPPSAQAPLAEAVSVSAPASRELGALDGSDPARHATMAVPRSQDPQDGSKGVDQPISMHGPPKPGWRAGCRRRQPG